LLAQAFREGFSLRNGSIDFVSMIEVIGKRRVDIRERQVVFGGDFIGALAHPLVPNGDILDRDAMAGDPRLAARYAWGNLDMLVWRFRGHVESPFFRASEEALLMSRRRPEHNNMVKSAGTHPSLMRDQRT
jgi:hypothetical protein